MNTAVVTTKGQIVIPSAIRKKHDIKKGTRLAIEERGDEIVLRPVSAAYFENIAGSLGTHGRLSQALIEDRAREQAREE